MGIRLDWDIEAEKSHVQGIGEDPDAARSRRAARLRLLITIFLLLTAIAAVGGFVAYRIIETERRLEELLRDTVAAEVTALRLGDWSAYADFQRSATEDWLMTQRENFEEYQELLLRSDNVRLTGRVLDAEIDDPRARVAVEEIIDGVPYTRIWYYWRYDPQYDAQGKEILAGGWHHVPPDFTFWGEPRTFQTGDVGVSYFGVDEDLAVLMGNRFQEWLTIGCDALLCQNPPSLTIEIRAEDVPEMDWSIQDSWKLQVLSPYASRARSDLPFTPEKQIQAATMLAERLVLQLSDNRRAIYPSDAYFLQQSAISWLVGQFVLIDTQSHLVASLASNYGIETVGQILREVGAQGSISLISQVTGAPLDQSNIDWRDYLTWRLNLENELILRQDSENFMALYDTQDNTVRDTAISRFSQVGEGNYLVLLVQSTSPTPSGLPQLLTTVQVSGAGDVPQEDVVFRLVNNQWVRAN